MHVVIFCALISTLSVGMEQSQISDPFTHTHTPSAITPAHCAALLEKKVLNTVPETRASEEINTLNTRCGLSTNTYQLAIAQTRIAPSNTLPSSLIVLADHADRAFFYVKTTDEGNTDVAFGSLEWGSSPNFDQRLSIHAPHLLPQFSPHGQYLFGGSRSETYDCYWIFDTQKGISWSMHVSGGNMLGGCWLNDGQIVIASPNGPVLIDVAEALSDEKPLTATQCTLINWPKNPTEFQPISRVAPNTILFYKNQKQFGIFDFETQKERVFGVTNQTFSEEDRRLDDALFATDGNGTWCFAKKGNITILQKNGMVTINTYAAKYAYTAAKTCALITLGRYIYCALGSDAEYHCIDVLAIDSTTGKSLFSVAPPKYALPENVRAYRLFWPMHSNYPLVAVCSDGKTRIFPTECIRHYAHSAQILGNSFPKDTL